MRLAVCGIVSRGLLKGTQQLRRILDITFATQKRPRLNQRGRYSIFRSSLDLAIYSSSPHGASKSCQTGAEKQQRGGFGDGLHGDVVYSKR